MLDTTTRMVTKCTTIKQLQTLTYDAQRYRTIMGDSYGNTIPVTIKYKTGNPVTYEVFFEDSEVGVEVLTVNGLEEVCPDLINRILSQC